MTPIIRIEMDGLKHSVMHHMQKHNDEFNEMVQEALEKTLNEGWVKVQIQQAVNNTVKSVINGLGDNWQLKSAVEDALSKSLSEMVENKTK
jgi:hypothetical protein